MFQRKNGATLSEILGKMGSQRHTVRGSMAGGMAIPESSLSSAHRHELNHSVPGKTVAASRLIHLCELQPDFGQLADQVSCPAIDIVFLDYGPHARHARPAFIDGHGERSVNRLRQF